MRKWNEQQTKLFERVRAGNDDGSGITIMWSGRVIETIAQNPECVANLTVLRLSMVNLSEPQIASAEKLVNVKTIDFYSCSDAENLLRAMSGLPSVQNVSFDTTSLSDEGVQLLASFPILERVHFAYMHEPSEAEVLRKSLPGVTIEIDEVGGGEEPGSQ